MNDKIFGDGSDGEITLSCEELTKDKFYTILGPSKDKICLVCKSPVHIGVDFLGDCARICDHCFSDPTITVRNNGYRVVITHQIEEEK